MKIGVFGGTFNPVHNGHIRLLECASSAIDFDKILVIPDFIPPHKSNDGVVDGIHRLNMCKLAFSHIKNVEVSDLELKRQGKSYTIDTLNNLKTIYPNDELWLIVGGDSLLNFKQWYKYDEILEKANIVTMARDLSKKTELNEMSIDLSKNKNYIVILDELPIEASSTEYRQGIKNLIPKEVENYISGNALYVNTDEIIKYIKENISEKRANHILNVADMAKKFANHFCEDENKAYLAGLLHDIVKETPKDYQYELIKDDECFSDPNFINSPQVWHGFAAAKFIPQKFKITDSKILNAIRFHSTGNGQMSRFEEILYMADLVSLERNYEGVEKLREQCFNDFNGALEFAFSYSISEQLTRHNHLLKYTVDAYNRYVRKIK